MKRLKCILAHGNKIASMSANLARTVPNVEEIHLIDNKLSSLAELDKLSGLKKLRALTLAGNPVTDANFYRLYAIHRIPSLAMLDFERVTLKERRKAAAAFKSGVGKAFEEAVRRAAVASAAAGAGGDAGESGDAAAPSSSASRVSSTIMSLEQQAAIREAIEKATSLEEIERLEAQLSAGNLAAVTASAKRQKTSR